VKWYYTGWTSFSFNTGDPITFNGPVDKIRFKDVMFGYNGKTYDVTMNMNSVTSSYAGAQNIPQTISYGQLNVYSFPIPGINDGTNKLSSSGLCSAPPGQICTKDSDCPFTQAGNCSSGKCAVCKGSPATTLVGHYKLMSPLINI
jgi:hypothetical protein